jgi:predicted transcriptional regulator
VPSYEIALIKINQYDYLSSFIRKYAMAQLDTRVLTAHVSIPLAEKVDALALRLDRSRGWVVKQALTAWIDQEEERSRLTHEALTDVAVGRVIDHEQVAAWADSLDSANPLNLPR